MKKKYATPLRGIVLLYTLWTPTLLAFALWLCWWYGASAPQENEAEAPSEESHYIYVYAEPEVESENTDREEVLWTVREFEEKIGIFSGEGVLLRVVDVYTKTLPKADRILLREGITVTSRQELYALMEDFGA